MSFDLVINRFEKVDQDLIKKKLAEWSLLAPFGERIAKNISTEHFLHLDKMEELLRFILKDKSLDSEKFEQNYERECYKYVLQGGDISSTPFPNFFGVAIEKKVLKKHLRDNYTSRFPDDQEAEDFIMGLKHSILPDDCKDVFIKQFNVWTTWNKDNPHLHPFEFCVTEKANEVRANLGLNKLNVSRELLLMIYEIPTHLPVLRPTIADAGLSQYFEPPQMSITEHGYTRTWEKQKWMEELDIKPRPEGIHTKIKFEKIILPLQNRW